MLGIRVIETSTVVDRMINVVSLDLMSPGQNLFLKTLIMLDLVHLITAICQGKSGFEFAQSGGTLRLFHSG